MAGLTLSGISKKFHSGDNPVYDPSLNVLVQDLKEYNYNKKTNLEAVNNDFALEDINLSVPDGKTLAIIGPSGCGKSTTLRIIAGLLKPDTGEVKFDNKVVNDIHPKNRMIGMVFQNYALYPHYKSVDNITSFFLFRKKTAEMTEEKTKRFKTTSELMGVSLTALLKKKPPALSGGEQQRVAIARCITREPEIFLLDEPFSNLDQHLREKYRINLKKLLKTFKITTVYVTHDQQEARLLGDIIAIMNEGRIIQQGTFEEIYNDPANVFIADFLNVYSDMQAVNFIDGEILNEKFKDMTIGIRPEEIVLCGTKKDNSIEGRIIFKKNDDVRNISVMCLQYKNFEIYTRLPSNNGFRVEEKVWIDFNKYFMFDKKTGNRILF